jgi:hypothetical protein
MNEELYKEAEEFLASVQDRKPSRDEFLRGLRIAARLAETLNSVAIRWVEAREVEILKAKDD